MQFSHAFRVMGILINKGWLGGHTGYPQSPFPDDERDRWEHKISLIEVMANLLHKCCSQ